VEFVVLKYLPNFLYWKVHVCRSHKMFPGNVRWRILLTYKEGFSESSKLNRISSGTLFVFCKFSALNEVWE